MMSLDTAQTKELPGYFANLFIEYSMVNSIFASSACNAYFDKRNAVKYIGFGRQVRSWMTALRN